MKPKKPVGIPKDYKPVYYNAWRYELRGEGVPFPWVSINLSTYRGTWSVWCNMRWERGGLNVSSEGHKTPRKALIALKKDIAEKTKDLLVFPGRRDR